VGYNAPPFNTINKIEPILNRRDLFLFFFKNFPNTGLGDLRRVRFLPPNMV